MSAPIQAGDLAEVIDGLQGKDSPNLGLIVKVMARVGEHSTLGPIWRCDAEYVERAKQGVDVPAGTADWAQSWLRKIEPPPVTTRTVTDTHIPA